ncbi:MAG TPA: ABC transporter permease [Phototrophicaceae bacterium]|nr:ABC transporter permease [Phototrophicaceae bacterium]
MADVSLPTQNVAAIEVQRETSGWRRALRRILGSPTTVIGLLLVGFAIALAILAPMISPYDPIFGNLTDHLQAPSAVHAFGTDEIGRDILSRVIYGSQISLQIALSVQMITLAVGLVLGLVSGYYGGWVDVIIMRIADIVMSFPLLIIAIALVGVLGSTEINIIVALALVSWPYVTRLTRSQVLSLKEQEYVTAARSLGASNAVIMFRHILPNLLTPVVVYVTLSIGGVILSEAALSFLGLGSGDQSQPSWGKMLNEAKAYIRSAWWMPFFPGMAIMLTVLGFNLLGDGLRDALDVRSQ